MATRPPSPVPVTPAKDRPTRASDLLAQFRSVRSHTSATKATRFSHVAIEPQVPSSAPVSPTNQSVESESMDSCRSSSRLASRQQNYATDNESEQDELQQDSLAGNTLKSSRLRRSPRTTQHFGQGKEIKLERYRKDPSKERRRKTTSILVSDMKSESKRRKSAMTAPKADTMRNRIRHDIEMHTVKKRDQFLLQHKQYFLPLLPENNYIAKLVQRIDEDEIQTIPHEKLDLQPAGITATLKPYQLTGLSFLVHLYKNGMNGILGDEMGLGKTLQTIALIQYIEEENVSKTSEERQPYLVICPMSVMSSWMAEVKRWAPNLKVLQLHGGVEERKRLKRVATGLDDRFGNEIAKSRKARKLAGEQDGNFDIMVTTYEIFVAESGWFKSAFIWKYVILDEGHKIKNNKTNVSLALQGLKAEYRLILTGTPLQNNLAELWALLHWLYPDVFVDKTADAFQRSFDLTKGSADVNFMENAKRLLEVIMLRRLKSSPDVNLGIPPKEEVLLYVPLTPMQKFWYMRLLTKAGDAVFDDLFSNVKEEEKQALKLERLEQNSLAKVESLAVKTEQVGGQEPQAPDAVGTAWTESREIMEAALQLETTQTDANSTKSAWTKLMNLVMQLRKCCTHPYQLPNAVPEDYEVGEHVILASGKFIVLRKLLQHLVMEKRKKVLIFSGFTGVLSCVEDLLSFMGINDHGEHKYLRLDGSTVRARRNLSIRLFNTTPDHNVMLISTRAGGLGINLATATEVIFLDQDWNPQQDIQAEARAHRIGQTKPVTVYKICTAGTVEEQMMGRIRKKLYLSAKITESMQNIHGKSTLDKSRGRPSTTEEMPQLSTTELKSLLRRGAQTLSRPEIDVHEMLSWNVRTILDKCRDKPTDPSLGDQKSNGEDEEQKWLSEMEKVQAAVYDGKKIQKQVKDEAKEAILPPEIRRADRRRGKNTTVMVDGYEISKASMGCADWEAVPTLAGKDPRLADPVRAKKAEIENQSICHVCWDGGDLVCCSGCPRSYHAGCLSNEDRRLMTSKFGASGCPQHVCADCTKKATGAGGMIYRCRWCERGLCEDCLDWDKTTLIGSNLPEFETLNFPAITQAYYITCPPCNEQLKTEKKYRYFVETHTLNYKNEHAAWLASLELTPLETESKPLAPSPVTSSEASMVPGLSSSSSETATAGASGILTPSYTSAVPSQAGVKRSALDVDGLEEALSSPEKRKKTEQTRPVFGNIKDFFRP